MEAPETAAHMAETSDMGDTHAVGETATSKMGDIYAAVSETVTSKMGGTYAAAETHAVMGDGPLGAYAHVAEVVAVPAKKYSPAGIVVICRWQVDGHSDILEQVELPLLGAEDDRMDIEAWLQGLGLERDGPAFRDNEIDWEVLPKLTSEDLRGVGV